MAEMHASIRFCFPQRRAIVFIMLHNHFGLMPLFEGAHSPNSG